MQPKTILLLSLLLVVLIITVSCIGLLSPGFYSAETLNWQAQCIGQDMIDLFLIVPALLITAVLSYKNNRIATMIWGGIMLYLIYTFTLYSFNVHFNRLFIIYCMCLGLAFYSFVYFLFAQYKKDTHVHLANRPVTRLIGIYFIVIGVLFYLLWLAEIIPAGMQNRVPQSVADTGLFTNGVHVLDLSVLLPGILLTGVFLLKKKPLGFMLTPLILSFFVFMDITIAVLAAVMKMKGVASDLKVSVIMAVLALVSLVLLIWYFKNYKPAVDQ